MRRTTKTSTFWFLLVAGGCLLGCDYDSRGDYVWSIGMENKFVVRRTMVETPTSHIHDTFEFKPQFVDWLMSSKDKPAIDEVEP